MYVVQVIRDIRKGDSISICANNIASYLKKNGVNNKIVTLKTDDSVFSCEIVSVLSIIDYCFEEDDIILYHFFGYHTLNKDVEKIKARKILIYHNVTPAFFFRDIDLKIAQDYMCGEIDARQTVNKYNHAIAMSTFSKDELISYGWKTDKVSVVPLIYSEKRHTEHKMVNKDEGYTILFVGRIVPNKKIEDLITALYYVKKEYEIDVKLFLVGNDSAIKSYTDAIKQYICRLSLDEYVEIVGVATDDELKHYYETADLYLCMSEHEGFCMPLIEAMEYGIPVIAYCSSAIPETMDGAGILVYEKNYSDIAYRIHEILAKDEYRQQIIAGQYNRIKKIGINNDIDTLLEIINKVHSELMVNFIPDMPEFIHKTMREYRDELLAEKIKIICEKKSCCKVIVYGAGKWGSILVDILVRRINPANIIFCDNNKKANSLFTNISCLNHKECVSKYGDSIYIIACKEGVVSIIRDLLVDKISLANIFIFDGEKRDIYK